MNDKLFSGLEAFQVYPIGYIHRDEGDIHLEVLPQFRPALKVLDQFSHMTVLFWAHEHGGIEAREAIDLQVEPPYAPGKMTGIFATRSQIRPNPILSTPCKIEAVDHEKGIIHVNMIDGFEGSPILDIKGYFPIMDRVNEAEIPEWLDWGLDHVPEEGLNLFEEMEE
ncbi:MAG: tRNA (N6-threonylcarbamoyladenosine(37)-N6)-methyltransferase TrmO [Chloroflexi bacterium]|nr:MAG: tRNA (N6-threonylcarbamoyladenosine(37)-N6)-methyltransferase TrmO [Chloroflexota bacterium]MBL1196883.1 tRNA (N6-threonylcarbamoyladenosine(37)-N6)-methyltransferase TrmO [Chloroflexota bacterium]NOH14179.1 tRNA (N6-threonylcarbamoyladenosine(37)-N6)-methyltransferase TrmO [Chloroflexota bacterium]